MDNEVKPSPYSSNVINQLFYIYIAAIIFWILIVILLKIYGNIVGIFFMFIPIILYSISIVNLKYDAVNPEDANFSGEMIVLGLFALLPILTWTHDKALPHSNEVVVDVLLAMIIGTSALYDVWIPTKNVIIVRHIRSILQVASIALLSYGLALLMYDVYNIKNDI